MTRKEIEKRALQILKDHKMLEIPVDPLKVAKCLNIRVMNAKFSEPDKSGAVTKRGGSISIYLNYDDISARKRFTIAHEIGHYILHINAADDDIEIVDTEDNFRSVNYEFQEWDQSKRMEWEANVFAAAILMNEELVRREWEKEKDLKLLAWKFQVSESAMAIRLSNLGITDDYL